MEPARPKGDDQAGKASKPKGKAKAGERFAVLNNFIDFTLADLTRGEIAVWLVLYRDTRDGTAGLPTTTWQAGPASTAATSAASFAAWKSAAYSKSSTRAD